MQNQLNGKSSTSHNHDGRYLKNIRVVTLTKTEGSGYINYTFPSIAVGETVYVYQELYEREAYTGRVFVKDNGTYFALWGTSVSEGNFNSGYMKTVTSNSNPILTYRDGIWCNMLLIRMA